MASVSFTNSDDTADEYKCVHCNISHRQESILEFEKQHKYCGINLAESGYETGRDPVKKARSKVLPNPASSKHVPDQLKPVKREPIPILTPQMTLTPEEEFELSFVVAINDPEHNIFRGEEDKINCPLCTRVLRRKHLKAHSVLCNIKISHKLGENTYCCQGTLSKILINNAPGGIVLQCKDLDFRIYGKVSRRSIKFTTDSPNIEFNFVFRKGNFRYTTLKSRMRGKPSRLRSPLLYNKEDLWKYTLIFTLL